MNRYKYIDEGKKHLHTLDGKPLIGTSGVSNVLSKPLHWWALQIGLGTLGYMPLKKRIDGKYITNKAQDRLDYASKWLAQNINPELSSEKWLSFLDTAYYAHSEKKDEAAEQGTDTHKMCEDFIKAHMAGQPLPYDEKNERIGAFVKWAKLNVAKFLWSEMYCYSEKYWIGGICDGGYITKDGHCGILDFKSSKEAYLSQYLQCSLYDVEITENGGFDREGNPVFKLEQPVEFYTIFPFGATKVEPCTRWDTEQLKVGGLSALNLYKLENGNTLGTMRKKQLSK